MTNVLELIEHCRDRALRLFAAAKGLPPSDAATEDAFSGFLAGVEAMFEGVPVQQHEAIKIVESMAAMGLSPHPAAKHCYLSQFRDKKTGGVKTQLMIGYQGIESLLVSSGWSIRSYTVREGEVCKFKENGDRLVIEHEFDLAKRSPIIEAAYCVVTRGEGPNRQQYYGYVSGDRMRQLKEAAREKRDSSGNVVKKANEFWANGPDSMARKAAIHNLLKTMPIDAMLPKGAIDSVSAFGIEGDYDTVTLPPSTPTVADSADMAAFYEQYVITPEEIDEVEARYPDPAERRAFIENNFDRKGDPS